MPPKTPSATVPKILKFGSVSFPVFVAKNGRIGFRYKVGSTWKQAMRTHLDDLRADAERIALSILNAETETRDMSAADRRIYIAAREALGPHNLQVDAVARDAAEAHRIVGTKTSLAELARFFVARNPSLAPAPPTAEIVSEFLAVLAGKGRSRIYRANLKADLTRFATAFPDLTACAEAEITRYLAGIVEAGASLRRRDNIRDAIVSLSRFAQRRKWLPDGKTVAGEIERIAPGVEGVTTFTPAEIAVILDNASAKWLPYFAIGAFAGLRNSEIMRLEWSRIKWEHGVIAVPASIAKKVRISRHAPLLPNLSSLLADYRDKHGPIYRHKSERAAQSAFARERERIEKKTGLRWKKNALRHSFGSYRLALINNPTQLALEMGNSPEEIREHYNDPKTESESKKWFGISRDTAANVMHLPLDFHAAR